MATVKTVSAEAVVFGNIGVSSSIAATAVVDFHDDDASMLNVQSSSTHFYTSPDGIFSMIVTALPFEDPALIDMVWDDVNQWFVLAYPRTIARWQFTHQVTNVLNTAITILEVKDNFGAELAIESWETHVPPGSDTDEQLDLRIKGNYGFSWQNIYLQPGETAQITLTTITRTNPAGKQHYGDCGLHSLNAQGVLKYRYDGMKGDGEKSIEGRSFRVKVCDKPPISVCFEVSATGVEWYIRKPGDYLANPIDGTVRVTNGCNQAAEVAVTFGNFANLKSDAGQQTPVFYALGDTTGLGNTDLGFGIHGVLGEQRRWLLDLGLGYRQGKAGLRFGIPPLPLGSWAQIMDNLNLSVGGSLYLAERLVLGIDAFPGEVWEYDLQALVLITRDITARIKAALQSTDWQWAEASLLLSGGDFLLQLAYTLQRSDPIGSIRIGVGYRF